MQNGGKRPGAGRKPGVPNKITTELKQAILQAAEEAHSDGVVGYLKTVAMTNSSAFVSLLGKVLPMQVTGEDGGAIEQKMTIEVVKL